MRFWFIYTQDGLQPYLESINPEYLPVIQATLDHRRPGHVLAVRSVAEFQEWQSAKRTGMERVEDPFKLLLRINEFELLLNINEAEETFGRFGHFVDVLTYGHEYRRWTGPAYEILGSGGWKSDGTKVVFEGESTVLYNPGLIVVAHEAVVEDPEAVRELSLNTGRLPDGNPVHVVCMLPARVVRSIAWIHEEELVGFQQTKPDRITVLRTVAEVRAELARRQQAREQRV